MEQSSIELAEIESSPELAELQTILDQFQSFRPETFNVLEAGCGSMCRLHLAEGAHLAGIDISERQLQRNAVLHEKILGDIQKYDFPKNHYDLIICWDVLEHLPEPLRAMNNLFGALKEGGMIILAAPNLYSVKGMVTKLTPHSFHVWAYRTFFGVKDAGIGDQRPFKTFLKLAMAPGAIRRLAEKQGFHIDYYKTYQFQMQKNLRKNAFFNMIFASAGVFGYLLSFGRVDLNHTDFIIALTKENKSV